MLPGCATKVMGVSAQRLLTVHLKVALTLLTAGKFSTRISALQTLYPFPATTVTTARRLHEFAFLLFYSQPTAEA